MTPTGYNNIFFSFERIMQVKAVYIIVIYSVWHYINIFI